jgi:hypothetical protein
MTDWEQGSYALDRHDRLWHAYSWHFGQLTWRGLGVGDDWNTADLEGDCGPLRRVQIVEVRG